MARTISNDALTKLTTQLGTEPISILEIAWVKGGQPLSYADRSIENIPGKILELSTLDNVINFSANSQSQQISAVLDDTDGTIKAIMDENDIHESDVFVYQHFSSLSTSEKFLLFRGKITSPVVYSEGDRTLAFTVLSQVEDTEIGFSAEEGQFDSVADHLIGQPWPMNFGTVVHGTTLHLDDTVKGLLAEGTGVADFALPLRVDAINAIAALYEQLQSQHETFQQEALQARDDATAQREADIATGFSTEKIRLTDSASAAFQTYNAQLATEKSSFQVIGGEDFPSGSTQIKINDVVYAGSFSGDVFTVASVTHPKEGLIETPFSTVTTVGTGGVIDRFSATMTGEHAGYLFNRAGDVVELVDEEGQEYVVSIVPGTVKAASAYINRNGVRKLVTIPTDFYSVETRDFGGITATILTITDALSKIEDVQWEDEIFVTFESSIGPNTVDVIEYLIDTYTSLSKDTASFDAVKTALTKYPSHFQIVERKQVLQVLQEIAWQARCAIWLSNGTFFLRYLPAAPSSIETITDSDVDVTTLEIGFTETEDIVTKLIANWRSTGAQDDDNRVILRHNVARYGTKEQTFNFYIYNHVDLVVKSATFWLIRYANTWKRTRFQTPLHKLRLEVFDGVTLDFNNTWVADSSVIGSVEQADYDSSANAIQFEVWTPVRAGELTEYDFAYPAAIDVDLKFPTAEDEAQDFDGGVGPGKDAGAGFNFGTIITNFNVVYDGANDPYGLGNRRNNDRGQSLPSDTNDVAPGNIVLPPLVTLTSNAPASPSPAPNNAVGILTNDSNASSINQIDIRTTSIVDSATDTSAKLDTVFQKIADDKIYLKSEVNVSDGEIDATMAFRYDAVLELYGAGLAFLFEEAP